MSELDFDKFLEDAIHQDVLRQERDDHETSIRDRFQTALEAHGIQTIIRCDGTLDDVVADNMMNEMLSVVMMGQPELYVHYEKNPDLQASVNATIAKMVTAVKLHQRMLLHQVMAVTSKIEWDIEHGTEWTDDALREKKYAVLSELCADNSDAAATGWLRYYNDMLPGELIDVTTDEFEFAVLVAKSEREAGSERASVVAALQLECLHIIEQATEFSGTGDTHQRFTLAYELVSVCITTQHAPDREAKVRLLLNNSDAVTESSAYLILALFDQYHDGLNK